MGNIREHISDTVSNNRILLSSCAPPDTLRDVVDEQVEFVFVEVMTESISSGSINPAIVKMSHLICKLNCVLALRHSVKLARSDKKRDCANHKDHGRLHQLSLFLTVFLEDFGVKVGVEEIGCQVASCLFSRSYNLQDRHHSVHVRDLCR